MVSKTRGPKVGVRDGEQVVIRVARDVTWGRNPPFSFSAHNSFLCFGFRESVLTAVIAACVFLHISSENSVEHDSVPGQPEEAPPAEESAAGLPAGRRNPPGGKSSLILG